MPMPNARLHAVFFVNSIKLMIYRDTARAAMKYSPDEVVKYSDTFIQTDLETTATI